LSVWRKLLDGRVVAQRESRGDGALDRAEALARDLAQQIGGGEAVHPLGRVEERLTDRDGRCAVFCVVDHATGDGVD
jgi:hypothetical protein